MTGKATQAGVKVAEEVVRAASVRDPVITYVIGIGAALLALSMYWMKSEIRDSRVETQSSMAALATEMRGLNAQTNARIDRLLERDK